MTSTQIGELSTFLLPTRGPCAAFFAVVPDQILKCIYTHLIGLQTLTF